MSLEEGRTAALTPHNCLSFKTSPIPHLFCCLIKDDSSVCPGGLCLANVCMGALKVAFLHVHPSNNRQSLESFLTVY